MQFDHPDLQTMYEQFHRQVQFTEHDWHLIEHYFKPITVAAKYPLQAIGAPVTQHYFIVSGLVRWFYITPEGKELNELTFIWVGDTCDEEPVNNSLAPLLLRLGVDVINCSPPGSDYQLNEKDAEPMRKAAIAGNSRFIQTSDISPYIGKADFLYTGTLFYPNWREDLVDSRKELFIPDYQVNMELVAQAPETVRFMHYLPALRDHEVTSEVMDSPYSVIYDQAENRMYTEMAILCALVYPRLKKPSAELKKQNKLDAEACLSDLYCQS